MGIKVKRRFKANHLKKYSYNIKKPFTPSSNNSLMMFRKKKPLERFSYGKNILLNGKFISLSINTGKIDILRK